MNHWLVKSDPDEYSAADLERDRKTVWDGVTNALAQRHLRAMAKGDPVLVYHSGKEKAVLAVAEIAGAPRRDPKDKTGKLVIVDLSFDRWLKNPISLAAIKSDPAFKDFALVRISRLSVMPVTPAQWERLMTESETRE